MPGLALGPVNAMARPQPIHERSRATSRGSSGGTASCRRSAISRRAASRPISSSPGTSGSAKACRRSASTFGEGWLDAYLDTPAWRFLLSPGRSAGSPGARLRRRARCSSVDWVGRHFPLTLVASCRALPDLAAGVRRLARLAAPPRGHARSTRSTATGPSTISRTPLADLAAGRRRGNAAVEDRLTTVRRALADAVARRGGFVDIAGISSRADLAAIFSASRRSRRRRGHRCAAWRSGSPTRRAGPQLLVSEGLPSLDEFASACSSGGKRHPVARRPTCRGRSGRPAFDATHGPGPTARGRGQPQVRNDDPLSMFGSPAAGRGSNRPAAHELLPDDDILALFQVGGDSASAAPRSAGRSHPRARCPRPLRSRRRTRPRRSSGTDPDDDILGLFNAGDSQAGQLGAEAARGEGRPARLFEVAPETPPSARPARWRRKAPKAARPSSDILDLLGVPPAEAGRQGSEVNR